MQPSSRWPEASVQPSTCPTCGQPVAHSGALPGSQRKSPAVVLILIYAFGPLGLLYVSLRPALIASTLFIVLLVTGREMGVTLIPWYLAGYPLTMIAGVILVDRANRRASSS